MKKIFIALMLSLFVGATVAEVPGVELSKRGKTGFNCCKGPRGSCAIYIADETSTPGVYALQNPTSVIYPSDYYGPYLANTYTDLSGRKRVDNVAVTFQPSNCIDPITGLTIPDCSTSDLDMYYIPVN